MNANDVMALPLAMLRKAAWAPILVLVLHAIASYGFDAYNRIPWIDIPMHLAGGLAISFFFLSAFTLSQSTRVFGLLSPLAVLLMVLSLTTVAIGVWEITEYTMDRYLGTQTQKGVIDTLVDILMGLAGASLTSMMYWRSTNPLTDPNAPG